MELVEIAKFPFMGRDIDFCHIICYNNSMKLKPIEININNYPDSIKSILENAKLYDSSCSSEASVIFADKDSGYFIKSSAKGALKDEALMTEYFNSLKLSARVIEYISLDKDYLVTEKIAGEDSVSDKYLANPTKLCDTLAENLSFLHSIDFKDCPIKNHTERYLARAEANYLSGNYDKSMFPDSFGYHSADEARNVILAHSNLLKNDTLLHGDYCLPNILLNDWKLSGFIDVCSGGVGDKHVDIFWAIWTLYYNFKTDKYTKRLIDAYGRDKIEKDALRLIAAIEVFG